SQAWNLAFSFYQSLRTIPAELREAATIARLTSWRRFTKLELPFATIGLVWNSMISWAGGWFFLMAAEQFTLGDKDFRLPGLGSYLKTAADAALWGGLAIRALLAGMTADDWSALPAAAGATLVRTFAALLIGTLWTVPLGVRVGLNPRLARRAQPLVQMAASIPATALFPV